MRRMLRTRLPKDDCSAITIAGLFSMDRRTLNRRLHADGTAFNIAGKGYTRFRATVGVDRKSLINEIGPRIRFFVFGEKPDHAHLVRVTSERPVSLSNEKYTANSLVTRLYLYALSRQPEPEERHVALELLRAPNESNKIAPEALEDLLWAVFQSREFQYIH